jgi:hypothetical protein
MKKIIYTILALAFLGLESCQTDWDELNKNPNQLEKPAPELVLNYVFRQSVVQMANNNMNYLWPYANQITIQASRYNTQNDGNWQNLYVNVLGNLTQLKKLYAGDPNYNNRLQIATIWECYIYAYLTGLHGPVPMSEAMSNSSSIKYDSENEVYKELLDRLKKASDAIDLKGDKLTLDPILSGSNEKWKKFANSLRLRIALRCIKNAPEAAIPAIQELMQDEQNLMTSNLDNLSLKFAAGDSNESPYYTRLVRNTVINTQYPKMNYYLFTFLRSYKDPRIDAYFERPAESDRYTITDTLSRAKDDTLSIVTYKAPHIGQDKTNAPLPQWGLTGTNPLSGIGFNSYSSPKGTILADNYAFKIMDYSEVCFLKAEVAELGFGGSKSADDYYYEGIRANLNSWSITDNQSYTDYIANNGIKWDTQGKGFNYIFGIVNSSIPSDNLAKIYIQRWLNYYPDGAFDAWCLQRQTQSLNLPPMTQSGNQFLSSDVTDIPDRWEYPFSSKSYNNVGYSNAVSSIGGIDYPNVVLNFAKTPVRVNWKGISGFYDFSAVRKQYGTSLESLEVQGVPYTVVSKFKKK